MSKAQRVQPAEQQEDLALKTVVNIVLKKGDVESLTHPSKVLFETRDGLLPPRDRRMMQFDRPGWQFNRLFFRPEKWPEKRPESQIC